MRMKEVIDAMREHDRVHAPGSESSQMQAFYEDLRRRGLASAEICSEAPEDFAAFWMAVASRNYHEASNHGDVSDEWWESLDSSVACVCSECGARAEMDCSPSLLDGEVRECPWCGEKAFSQVEDEEVEMSEDPNLLDVQDDVEATRNRVAWRLVLSLNEEQLEKIVRHPEEWRDKMTEYLQEMREIEIDDDFNNTSDDLLTRVCYFAGQRLEEIRSARSSM